MFNIGYRFQVTGNRQLLGKPLRGFSIDGITKADATIQNKIIVIDVKGKPAFIYYAWKPFTDANLVNSELLPASTFKITVD